jgi:hypothetical protein
VLQTGVVGSRISGEIARKRIEKAQIQQIEIGSVLPRWKAYELKHGGQQTNKLTVFQGQEIFIRLDKPPMGSRIVDFKDYDWSNPSDQNPFIQEVVSRELQVKILTWALPTTQCS